MGDSDDEFKMVQTQYDLTELLKAYMAAEPNRARGGIVALTGFEYQIWSYLADFAVALSSNELIAGGAQFAYAFETLSDYTSTSGIGTICVQVKHHLDRRNMSFSAAEFAAIERFLHSHTTLDLRDQIAYEVVARSGSSSLDWATIELPSKIVAREPDLLDYFEKLRVGGRLLAPRFDPDPQWRLIATVYMHLADPFGFARRAFEICMRRSKEPASAAFVRSAIAEDFAASVHRRPQSSRSLSASDFSRDSEGSGISLARTPTLADLRYGRFMERPKRVADALALLDDNRSRSADLREAAIPVLWIDGRSGCGKSALLLQIMERLVERQSSVIWFANGTEEVGAIIEQLASTEAYLRPEFLVVDDIYDPQARDDLDLARLTRLIVHSGVTTWPTLITCGPTEFRQDFERDCRAEGFHITSWHLSTLEPAETTSLLAWFQSRTGRVPERGPASTEPRALMISVLFELEHGDLRPFANRFRNRLAQEQLDSVLSLPLALNRLYIWTPRHWLSADEEARLERLNQDGDFSLLAVEGRGRGLFKLTHPHLSDAIYRALYPGALPTTFAKHLVTAFSRALASSLPTAARLLRAVGLGGSRFDILDEEEFAAGMTTAWNTWDKSGLDQSAATDMWIDWAKWAARHSAIASLLSESPLETAIQMLGNDGPRWPSRWLRLWASVPGEPTLELRAVEWLSSHIEVDGWYSIWRQVTEHSIQYSREMNKPSETTITLCLLGSAWLKVSSHVMGWARIWTQLVAARDFMPATFNDEVIKSGVAWVLENHNAHSWKFVWEKLAELSHDENSNLSGDEINELGLTWLKEHENHPGWPFTWQHFIARPSPRFSVTRGELLRMAMIWSSTRENDPGWVFIAAKLAAEADQEAKESAFERLVLWIETHADSPHWPIIWYKLFEADKGMLTQAQRRRLFIASIEWVSADDQREYASFVLTHIVANMKAFPDVGEELELLNGALEVLSRTLETDDREWPNLRMAVVNHVRSWPLEMSASWLDMLRTLGRRWIGVPAHLSHGAWSQVYRGVYRIGEDDEGTNRDLAVKGIVQGLIPDAAAFAAMLYSLQTTAPPDQLLQWLEQWFSGPARESGGFSIWMRLDRGTRKALEAGLENQWIRLRSILDLHRPDQVAAWENVIYHYRQRRPIKGRVVKTVLKRGGRMRSKRLGYVVDIGTNAFLPLEETGIHPGSESARLAMVGKILEFDIIRLDELKLQVERLMPNDGAGFGGGVDETLDRNSCRGKGQGN